MAELPASISASIRLDADGRLYGWVFDPRDLERRFVVEILGDGLSLAVVRAELHIARLRDEGHGDGCYGFAIGLDPRVSCHRYELLIANTAQVLAHCGVLPSEVPGRDLPSRGHVLWRGGLRLSGAVQAGSAIAGAPELQVYLGSRRLDATPRFHASARVGQGRQFDLLLPPVLADGRLQRLRILDSEGGELEGSPLTILAHPRGFGGLAGGLDRPTLAFLDDLVPASLPLENYELWARQHGEMEDAGDAQTALTLGVLILGGQGAEATLASLAAQRGPFHLRTLVIGEAEEGSCFRPSEWAAAREAFAAPGIAAALVLPGGSILKPCACQRMAAALSLEGGDGEPPALIIGDYEQIGGAGEIVPFFGPAFDYERMLSQGYAAGILALRRLPDICGAVDGVRSGYDILFAALEGAAVAGRRVAQIPRVLARLPRPPGDCAARLAAAVAAHLSRTGQPASVEASEGALLPLVHVRRQRPDGEVAIVIPTRDRLDLLRPCIESIHKSTLHPDYRIVVVDNGSRDTETLDYLRELSRNSVTILRDDGVFNYARLNNLALREISSPFACLLNDDVEVLTPDWLVELQSPFSRAAIGGVGARLIWPNGMLQHGGVVLGMNFGAGHAYDRYRADEPGYADGILATRECSALTAACLMLRRQDFWNVGGLDEAAFPVAFNDVDLCLRLREAGKALLWNPHAQLLHRESASRGSDAISPARRARFDRELAELRRRWGPRLRDDDYYSPNLNLDAYAFTGLALPPRDRAPRLKRVRF
jgi:GT2 family glycosyltransferase